MSNLVKKYDVAYKWERDSKDGWATIGIAFLNESGSISINLNSLPVPGLESMPGKIWLFPKDDDLEKNIGRNSKSNLKKKISIMADRYNSREFDDDSDGFSKNPEPPF